MTRDPPATDGRDARLVLTEEQRIGAPSLRPADLSLRIDALRAAIAAGRKARPYAPPVAGALGAPVERPDPKTERIRHVVREEIAVLLAGDAGDGLRALIRREVARALAARRR